MTPEYLAYRDRMRTVAWQMRLTGLTAIVAGCGLMLAFRYAGLPWLIYPGFALLGTGWLLQGYAIWRRTQWAKANPFTGQR